MSTDKHANTVRAVSVHYGHARAILEGRKTIEYRSFNLSLGDLVICTTARDSSQSWQEYNYKAPTSADLGVTLCLVSVVKSVDCDWYLANVRPLVRHPIKGALGIWRLDASLVQEIATTKPARKPRKAKEAPIAVQAKAVLVEAPKAPSLPDCAALVARCKVLQSTLEIADLLTEIKRRTVEAYRKIEP